METRDYICRYIPRIVLVSKKKEKVYQMEKSRFHHHRSLRSFPRRGYSSLNVLTVLRHTFNTILLYLATLLSDITDIKCHAISF